MKLLKGDLIQGFIYGLFACIFIGFWGILMGVVCALLWALGGQGFLGFNAWRRQLMPFTMVVTLAHHNWADVSHFQVFLYTAAYFMQWGALSIGYGTPDATDKGSFLGRIFGNYSRVVWWIILLIAMSPMTVAAVNISK